MGLFKYLIIIIILLFPSTILSQPVYTIDETFQYIELCPGLEYIEDTKGTLKIDDVEKIEDGWLKSREKNIALGFSSSAWWFRFSAKNSTISTADILLKINNPLFDYIDLYKFKKNKIYSVVRTGDQVSLGSREIKSNVFLFNLTPVPGVNRYYFRIKTTSSIKLRPVLMSMNEHLRITVRDRSIIWFLSGWLIILILYNVFIYFAVRRAEYIFFVLLVFWLLVLRLTTLGYLAYWGLPSSLNNISIALVIFFSIISGSYFLQLYFDTKGNYPKFHWLLQYVVNAPIICILLVIYFIPYRYTLIIANAYGFFFPLLFFLISVYTSIKRNRQGYFLLAGFSIILIIMLFDGFYIFGLVSRPSIFNWFYNIGLAWLMLFSSLGLADSLNLMGREIQKKGYIIEYASSAIATSDTDGYITYVNPAFLRMWGFEDESEVLGMSYDDLWILKDIPDRISMKNQFKKQWSGEIRAVRKDGSVFDVQVSASQVLDQQGKIDGYMSSSVDITEKKNSERELLSSLKEKETLLKEIHHRVKNNLGVIYSLLQFEIDSKNEKPIDNVLKNIQDRISSMSLAHQRLYKSQDLSSINFQGYCADLFKYISESYGCGSRIEIIQNIQQVSLNIETVLPLGLIIVELVTNSIKHGFPGNREGKIMIDFSFGEDNNCAIIINDNGIGLPEMYNFEDAVSMGFFIVRSLVEQISGRITLSQGDGVSFIINFQLSAGQIGQEKL